MIELVEATIIAGQIDHELRGKRIGAVVAAGSPHKFAFMTGTPEEYEGWLVGRTIIGARPHGSNLIVTLDNGYEIILGGGGERILYHPSGDTLPKKHQLLLSFDDGSYLSVSIQGWGSVQVFAPEAKDALSWLLPKGHSPLTPAFTADYFRGLVAPLASEDKRSCKFALISEPGVWGVGNGYLQDILFAARLHPRRRIVDVSPDGLAGLHAAIVDVMGRALAAGGRDTERDLYDQPGGYVRLMDSRTVGQPCPACGTAIEKISFLGGACYFCPQCQS